MTNEVHCSKCFRSTNHELIFDKTTTEISNKICYEPEVWVQQGFNYSVFECCGCHNVVMRKRFWHSDLTPPEYDESYISWHPALTSRQLPKWRNNLPENWAELLCEIYRALHCDSRSLALMGMRALLDMYLVEAAGDLDTFNKKLEWLQALGFLSANQVELIKPAIEAGNAAAHRGYSPSQDGLDTILNLIELLLHQWTLASAISKVKDDVPPRKRKQ